VLLQSKLPFEVSMIDSIHWRTGRNEPNRAGSSRRSGRTSRASRPATYRSTSAPARPWSTMRT
jgi:hypothetical protein